MKTTLNEIAQWKIDASHKLNRRYFYKPTVLSSIENGSAPLIVGRKGTGKTALALHLADNVPRHRFASYLDFRELRAALHHLGYKPSPDGINPWITVWKALLGHEVVKLIAGNASLNVKASRAVKKYITDSCLERDLNQVLQPSSVTTTIEIPYIEYTKTVGDIDHSDGRLWAPIQRQTMQIMEQYCDETLAYFVIIDSVGDDVRTISDSYQEVVVGLIKAAIQLRVFADDHDLPIYPCVFLRDDIFRGLIDPDASKWCDYALPLSWGEHSLRQLLAYRIHKAVHPASEVPETDFKSMIKEISTLNTIRYKNKSQPLFDWIWKRTHSRPRDFVRFFRIAARMALTEGCQRITPKNWKKAGKIYSEEFRRELRDEMTG